MNAVNYHIADMTICVRADLPITESTFARKLDVFRGESPGGDTLLLHHHFGLPAISADAREQHATEPPLPLMISREGSRWIYDGYRRYPAGHRHVLRMEWDAEHTRGDIYHADETRFRRGGLESLTAMTTDQILLARVLADRAGCLLHAAGMALSDSGMVFLGHSSAGKSTMVTLLRDYGEILCDDRIAVRCAPDGFRLYGTWSHGDVSDISPASAPLKAICFLEKAETNQAILLTDRRSILSRLLPCLIQPFSDADWWGKSLATIDLLLQQVPAYRLLFDRSGRIAPVVLQQLL